MWFITLLPPQQSVGCFTDTVVREVYWCKCSVTEVLVAGYLCLSEVILKQVVVYHDHPQVVGHFHCLCLNMVNMTTDNATIWKSCTKNNGEPLISSTTSGIHFWVCAVKSHTNTGFSTYLCGLSMFKFNLMMLFCCFCTLEARLGCNSERCVLGVWPISNSAVVVPVFVWGVKWPRWVSKSPVTVIHFQMFGAVNVLPWIGQA